MTSYLPVLVIFSLEFTLFPYNVDRDLAEVPLEEIRTKFYSEVPEIFKILKRRGIVIAVIYDYEARVKATEIIDSLGWNEIIRFNEEINALNGTLEERFADIQRESQVKYDEMIYFDYKIENIETAQKMGIFSTPVNFQEGMTVATLTDALEQYTAKRKREIKPKVFDVYEGQTVE